MTQVLAALIRASERAASIARSCTNSNDETLCVTEKCETEANARFDRDFKTIADVLAQECAKTEIRLCFPDLSNYVRGEECNEIGGVTISLQGTVEETTELLSSLVPLSTAKRMADAAHATISHTLIEKLPNIPLLNPDDLGVWIDPIDATAEFIAGVQGLKDENRGLSCVTILIGAYSKSSGEPVIGVINQPFYNGGTGRIIWGIDYEETKKFNGINKEVVEKIVLVSGAEDLELVNKLKNSGWVVQTVPGAGYKLLKVALGEAAAYVVSKGTTFRWDTCAPNAILKARGGGILTFSTRKPITYNDMENLDTKEYCNSEGIIAYAEESTLMKILSTLS